MSIGHKAILASAGSGKTFRLAHRYIRLLADGLHQSTINHSPLTNSIDNIAAMTFTRKAAGEIFDSIAEYLRKAAADEDGAVKLTNERIGISGLKQSDYLLLLRRFVDGMHRSKIGTFDRFIIGIARTFPVELGIPMSFDVTETGGAQDQENRRRILDQILGGHDADKMSKKFLDAFRQATYGHEEKKLGTMLEELLSKQSFQYRLCQDGDVWGNPDRIWKEGERPYAEEIKVDGDKILAAANKWTESLPQSSATDVSFVKAFKELVAELVAFTPLSPSNELLGNKLFIRMFDQLDEMRRGEVGIKSGRSIYTIPSKIAASLAELIHNVFHIEYDRMLRRTGGLYELLDSYETVYQDVARSSGSFSFNDVQYLLANDVIISRSTGADRLYIDYRMDCKLDHWLLDEFQDTSDLQWSVFENLISEIVQAPPEDGRSFFYVGDVKQAIYRWRGGNHDLFLDIKERFNREGTVIDLEPIQKTYRCSQAVIDVVNSAFGELPEILPENARTKWTEVWNKHETAAPDADNGFVGFFEPLEAVSSTAAKEARYNLVADLLNEIQPTTRGLTTGVLVRDNKFGRTLVDVLNRECPGIDIILEGEAGIINNEVARVFLSLVKLAAHPGDEYAWQYLCMGPMMEILNKNNITRSNIAPSFLTEIQENGFQEFVRNWGARLALQVDLTPYGRECLDRFESAAAEFDSSSSSGCNSFVRFIESFSVREQPAKNCVRVMTIHQSKGLEFDVVILPQLQDYTAGNMTKASSGDLMIAGERSNPEWILKSPRKIISEHDKVLMNQLQLADSEHSYDALCGLYVAMTRARHGLYLVSSHAKSASSSFSPAVFLKEQLLSDSDSEADPVITLNGNEYLSLYNAKTCADWYKDKWPVKEAEESSEYECSLSVDYASLNTKRKLLKHREPSKQQDFTRKASTLFEAESADIMDFGSAIHEMFEQVTWADDADIDQIVADWEPTSAFNAAVTRDAIEQFRKCMSSDVVTAALSKPCSSRSMSGMDSERKACSSRSMSGMSAAAPWVEKRFEVVVGDEFVSGAFDRVIVIRDGDGKPVSATVLDYKSSLTESDAKIDEKVKHYTPQMETYRDALGVILGLPAAAIACKLIFTKQQQVRSVG